MKKIGIFPPLLLLLLIGTLCTSCAKQFSIFNASDKMAIEKSKFHELNQVQFYISERILLIKESAFGEVKISKGKIAKKNFQKDEVIEIEPVTPGVLIFSSEEEDLMHICFGPDRDKFLSFSIRAWDVEAYVIETLGKDGEYFKVLYGNEVYYMKQPGERAHLLVEKEETYSGSRSSRTAKGVKIK